MYWNYNGISNRLQVSRKIDAKERQQEMKKKLLGLMVVFCMFIIGMPATVLAEGMDEAQPNEMDNTETVVYTDENDDPLNDRAEGNIDAGFYGDDENAGINMASLYDAGYSHDARFNGYMVRDGIDVSYHQGNIDWNAVKNAGIEFAFVRVGYRGYGSGQLNDDVRYVQNLQGALNAGLRVGVYVFSQAINETEAVQEANYILGRIGGYNITLPVVIDYEYTSDPTGRLVAAGLSADQQTSICAAFCNTVAARGYTPMIYANYDMLVHHMNGTLLGTNYKIWLARYNSYAGYAGNYTYWQYTSNGSVPGISGRVDRNFWYDNSTYATTQQTADTFVRRLYISLLGRTPSDSEVNGWSRQLQSGTTAATVASGFVDSAEFQNTPLSSADCVDRIYRAILGRGADANGIANWGSKLDNGVSRKFVLKSVVESNEFANICNSMHINRGAVSLTETRDLNYNLTWTLGDYYRQYLGRNYDVDGLNFWCQQVLYNGMDMATVAQGFINSVEFTNSGISDSEYVTRLYRGIMGREPDAEGKAHWENYLSTGMSRDYVLKGFTDSVEFTNLCASRGVNRGTVQLTQARDRNPGVTAFVARNYTQFLGRTYDVDGLNHWTNQITTGAGTPATVAWGFAFSTECKNKNLSNTEFVRMLYRGCFGRESDVAGEQYWLWLMQSGRMNREQVFWGFINSDEYRNMVRSFGL